MWKRIKSEVTSIAESVWANVKPQITAVLNKASDHVLAIVIASLTVGAGALTTTTDIQVPIISDVVDAVPGIEPKAVAEKQAKEDAAALEREELRDDISLVLDLVSSLSDRVDTVAPVIATKSIDYSCKGNQGSVSLSNITVLKAAAHTYAAEFRGINGGRIFMHTGDWANMQGKQLLATSSVVFANSTITGNEADGMNLGQVSSSTVTTYNVPDVAGSTTWEDDVVDRIYFVADGVDCRIYDFDADGIFTDGIIIFENVYVNNGSIKNSSIGSADTFANVDFDVEVIVASTGTVIHSGNNGFVSVGY
jgi:hypothetical protein